MSPIALLGRLVGHGSSAFFNTGGVSGSQRRGTVPCPVLWSSSSSSSFFFDVVKSERNEKFDLTYFAEAADAGEEEHCICAKKIISLLLENAPRLAHNTLPEQKP